jgi:hypothetical protein
MTTYDGSGRMTAQEIADAYGEGILAGASQLMSAGAEHREVFPSFLTRHYHGSYNWQSAAYEVRTRQGNRLVTARKARTRAR